MKTIEQIKNKYAESKGYGDWENLDYNVNDSKEFDDHWKNICIIAQKQCLRNASEKAEVILDHKNSVDYDYLEKTITNEKNIVI